MKRFLVIPPTIAGVLVAWFVSAFIFIFYDYVTHPFIGLLVLYAIVAWSLRWWHELRIRLPIAIFFTGLLFSYLRPIYTYKIHMTELVFSDLFYKRHYLGSLDWALTGAIIGILLVALTTPISPFTNNKIPESVA